MCLLRKGGSPQVLTGDPKVANITRSNVNPFSLTSPSLMVVMKSCEDVVRMVGSLGCFDGDCCRLEFIYLFFFN